MKKQYQTIMLLSALSLTINSVYAQTKEITLKEALQLASKGNRHLQIQVLQNKKIAYVFSTNTIRTTGSGSKPCRRYYRDGGSRKRSKKAFCAQPYQ